MNFPTRKVQDWTSEPSPKWIRENEAWLKTVYARHPRVDGYLKAAWEKKRRQAGMREANTELRRIVSALKYPENYSASMDVEDVADLAEYIAEECEHKYKALRVDSDIAAIRKAFEGAL